MPSSSSAAPAAIASGSNTEDAGPANDESIKPIATVIDALCIDPPGINAPTADSRAPRSPDEPPPAGSSKPDDVELAKRQANMQKLRAQMDAVNAERIASGVPLPVKASPPRRLTVEEQQANRDRKAADEANVCIRR